MRKSFRLIIVVATILIITTQLMAQEISSEAQRHMIRGEAAMEMAETKADYQDAVREFKAATQLVPNWADAWFNLGVAQNEAAEFAGAMSSFEKYVALSPNAPDRSEIETLIIKLGYQRDKAQRVQREDIAEDRQAKQTEFERTAWGWCTGTSSRAT